MKNNTQRKKPLFFFLLVLFLPLTAVSQIYKWVDEDGKVHFGDKPKESPAGQLSEKVELKEGYVPGEAIPEEQIEAQKDFLRKKDQQRALEQQQQQEALARRKEQQQKCQKMRDRIKDFTTAKVVNGRVQRNNYFTENGQPVTSDRQDEIVAELEQSIARQCD
ncbi:DUF4124 domain-containing protein [Oceanicoccus sagamiensis]|uniref:DUF4124 domain-containing protein n=1 Tax=Oceanicoccus sagamiensis TaxID=716816 RepID=A0A1X9NFU9_9GAMM|nr:DUF4124 domain-containing protein [Oceanicoccus sagamiensis]ARN74379.1 hypothetical protein BST96_09740 [Oceanicoccus sagamiensis]